jgi:hypothetical protein
MSNYCTPTRHPITREIKMADWLDDSFGRHIYGVRFHGEEKIYPSVQCAEISPDEMLEEIERLRAALMQIAETPDHYTLHMVRAHARAALAECKTNAAP